LVVVQENQMLTPKLSLRRRNVLASYQPVIDAMYKGKGHRVHYKPSSAENAKNIEM
jgi:hypothetical protein